MRELHQTHTWHAGWYRHARHLASPNFGPRPSGTAIELLILHSISLPPGEFGNDNIQKLFTNQLDCDAHPYFEALKNLQVSAHFFISRNGALWQFVSCEQRAWHAGQSAYRGRSDCNDYSIGIELEGLEGGRFDQLQYDSLAALGTAILKQYPVRQVVGHEHVAPGRKFDPGPGFDWRVLERCLGVPADWLPAGVREPMRTRLRT